GEHGWLVVPFISGVREENPTISITPMQGEEFTQRLLTPFPEHRLTLLLRQGYDVDALLRLMGAEIHLDARGSEPARVCHNRPSDHEGYPVYRRIMAHFSSIQDRHALYVEPLHYQLEWTVPVSAITPEAYGTTYKDLTLSLDAEHDVYHVS